MTLLLEIGDIPRFKVGPALTYSEKRSNR